MLVEPNWDIFNAKFSNDKQWHFEWFCYLLFCKEFNKPFGIFRFFNQAGIETTPVNNGDRVIGFQAKYYKENLSKNESDIIDSIKKAKNSNSNLTDFYFYSHQDWTTTKEQGKTTAQIHIEEYCKSINLNIEWRTASFFESEFVCDTCSSISAVFFTNNSLIEKVNQELNVRTDILLASIMSDIKLAGKSIKFNRNEKIDELKSLDSNCVIVHGAAGVGKTAFIKDLKETFEKTTPFYCIRANEFNAQSLPQIFIDFLHQDIVDFYKNEKEKKFVIDSAEKLIDSNYQETFCDFVNQLVRNNWKIIFTTRNSYLDQLIDILLTYNIKSLCINIDLLTESQLNDFFSTNNLHKPKNESLNKLLLVPFYLNEYLKYCDNDIDYNVSSFKNHIWSQKINRNRENEFIKIAVKRANTLAYFLDSSEFNNDIINTLVIDGILGKENSLIFITHDIYEEWALERFVETKYKTSPSKDAFFDALGTSFAVRRIYRFWIKTKLEIKEDIRSLIDFTISKFSDAKYKYWADETITAIFLSDYAQNFFESYENFILKDNCILLKRLSFILRIACKEFDNETFDIVNKMDLGNDFEKYYFTKPVGSGWNALIDFVSKNISTIGFENIKFIVPILSDWTQKYKSGDTTKIAASLALDLYKLAIANNDTYNETCKDLIQIICNGAKEIKDLLVPIFSDIHNKGQNYNTSDYGKFIDEIISNMKYSDIYMACPKELLSILEFVWLEKNEKSGYRRYSISMDIETYYNIRCERLNDFPPSALKTPIPWLLRADFSNTLNFIIYFTNKTVLYYKESQYDESLKDIDFDVNGERVKQISSQGLWEIFRGTSSPYAPYLLQSIHMALEKFLLENASETQEDVLESILFYILKKSKSVSLTAIVASVVIANPKKTFNVAATLFKVKDFLKYDFIRCYKEHEARTLYSIGFLPHHQFDYNERIKTCDEEFRKSCLENIFLQYQAICYKDEKDKYEYRVEILNEIIDSHYKELPPENEQTDEDKRWRIQLARIDFRKMKVNISKTDKENQFLYSFEPTVSNDIKEFQSQSKNQTDSVFEFSNLRIWSSYCWDNDKRAKDYKEYDNNPSKVVEDIKKLVEKLTKRNIDDETNPLGNSFLTLDMNIPAIACSCIVRDNFETLTYEQKEFCFEILYDYALLPLKQNYYYQIMDGTENAISVIGTFFNSGVGDDANIKSIVLLNLFLDGKHSEAVIKSIKKIIAEDNLDAFYSFIYWYSYLKPVFNSDRLEFLKNNETVILEKIIEDHFSDLQRFMEDDTSIKSQIKIENLFLNEISILFSMFSFKFMPDCVDFVDSILTRMIELLQSKKDYDDFFRRNTYEIRIRAIESYISFLFSLEQNQIEHFLIPFLETINKTNDCYSDFFRYVIFEEISSKKIDIFWTIWNISKEYILNLYANNIYGGKLLETYLFATPIWNENIQWSALKESNSSFFDEIVKKLGKNPSVLYSISFLLSGIGSHLIEKGLSWISFIVCECINDNFKIIPQTIPYLEKLIKKYIFTNRKTVRENIDIKQNVVLILNFLVEQGSVVGYMLRENVL